MRKLWIAVLIMSAAPLWAQSVLATNAWTAAFAEAAGVEGTIQLAPSEMTHPPEYELRPSDVKKVRDADVLVFAGYEVLMKTVMGELGASKEKMVQIITSYNPEQMESSLKLIAQKAGDSGAVEAFMKEYNAELENIRGKLKSKGLQGADILVHFHQKPLAEALGFKILGVFGPGPLKASDIARFGSMNPVLILDNGHNPQAAPLAELSGAPVAELVNFPGGTGAGGKIPSDLKGVASYNGERILELKLK